MKRVTIDLSLYTDEELYWAIYQDKKENEEKPCHEKME